MSLDAALRHTQDVVTHCIMNLDAVLRHTQDVEIMYLISRIARQNYRKPGCSFTSCPGHGSNVFYLLSRTQLLQK